MKKLVPYLKFVLDLLLGVVFALLFNTRVLGGMTFHEIAGLALGGAVLAHVLLNARWVKKVTLAIFDRGVSAKTRIGYIVDVLLLLDLVVILVSGLFISRVVFPGLNVQGGWFNQSTHVAASYLGLGLIGIHVGLHWRWVMGVVKRLFHVGKTPLAVRFVAAGAAVLLLGWGVANLVTTRYFQSVSQLFSSGSARGGYEVRVRDGSGVTGDQQLPRDAGSLPEATASAGSGTNDNSATGDQELPSGEGNSLPGADDSTGSGTSGDQSLPGGDGFHGKGGQFGGQKPGNGTEGGDFAGGERGGSANILGVLATYLPILAAFAIATYYAERLLRRRRRPASSPDTVAEPIVTGDPAPMGGPTATDEVVVTVAVEEKTGGRDAGGESMQTGAEAQVAPGDQEHPQGQDTPQ